MVRIDCMSSSVVICFWKEACAALGRDGFCLGGRSHCAQANTKATSLDLIANGIPAILIVYDNDHQIRMRETLLLSRWDRKDWGVPSGLFTLRGCGSVSENVHWSLPSTKLNAPETEFIKNPFISSVAMSQSLSGKEPLVASHNEQKRTPKQCRFQMDSELFVCTSPMQTHFKLSAGPYKKTN